MNDMENAIIKQEEQAQPLVPTQPQAGDIQWLDGKRQAWDATAKYWRVLSKKHCAEGINPFDGHYKPVPPFTKQPFKTSIGSNRLLLTDANGVRLNADLSINKHFYPPSLEHLLKNISKPKLNGTKAMEHTKTAAMFWRLARHDDHFARLFDEQGKPRLDMVRALWLQIINLIFSQKDVQGKFLEQLKAKALEDPMGTFEQWSKLTGSQGPVSIGIMTGGQQPVGINIFQRDEIIDIQPEEQNGSQHN